MLPRWKFLEVVILEVTIFTSRSIKKYDTLSTCEKEGVLKTLSLLNLSYFPLEMLRWPFSSHKNKVGHNLLILHSISPIILPGNISYIILSFPTDW